MQGHVYMHSDMPLAPLVLLAAPTHTLGHPPTPRPPAGGGANEKEDPGVHTILLHPLHPDQLFVSNQSSTCYLMNMNGQVIKALQSGKRQGGGEAHTGHDIRPGSVRTFVVIMTTGSNIPHDRHATLHPAPPAFRHGRVMIAKCGISHPGGDAFVEVSKQSIFTLQPCGASTCTVLSGLLP